MVKTKHALGPLQVGLVVAFAERDNHGAHGNKNAIELNDCTGDTLAYVIKPEHVSLFVAAPDMLAALKVISIALREPAGGEYWSVRKFLDDRGIFNGDLDGERVLLRVANAAIAKAGGK